MTNTRDKSSGRGGDEETGDLGEGATGDGKKTKRTASVPIENCLTVGCSRYFCVQLVYKKAGLKGLKMDLSNAESTTDS